VGGGKGLDGGADGLLLFGEIEVHHGLDMGCVSVVQDIVCPRAMVEEVTEETECNEDVESPAIR